MVSDDAAVCSADQHIVNHAEETTLAADNLSPDHIGYPRQPVETSGIVTEVGRVPHGDDIRADRVHGRGRQRCMRLVTEERPAAREPEASQLSRLGVDDDRIDSAELFGRIHVDDGSAAEIRCSNHQYLSRADIRANPTPAGKHYMIPQTSCGRPRGGRFGRGAVAVCSTASACSASRPVSGQRVSNSGAAREGACALALVGRAPTRARRHQRSSNSVTISRGMEIGELVARPSGLPRRLVRQDSPTSAD